MVNLLTKLEVPTFTRNGKALQSVENGVVCGG